MKRTELKVENPYVGPRPFEERHQRRFFGRDWETNELVSLVVAHPAVLLYAQSGAGKTSLINAKLVPLLRDEEGLQVMPMAQVRGEVPQEIQPEQIENLFVFNTLLGWIESGADPAQLVGLSLSAFLAGWPRPQDEEGQPTLRVVIFDQFEELFTLYPERWTGREGFFAQVADALSEDSFLRVLFVLREDYLAQLDPYVALLPERLRTRFRLERLRQEAALAAVRGPLMDTKRSFAPGVAEGLVEELLKIRVEIKVGETVEVPGEFVEPVQLQVVCWSLWDELPPDIAEITRPHLRAFGDVDQALRTFYERALRSAVQQVKVREGKLRAWFERELITPMGTRGTAYRGAKSTGGVLNAAIDALESQHLIRAERRAGARWYELTHDRFIGPIQRSNETWRAARRQRWLRIAGGAMATLILLVFLALLGMRGWEQSQALALQATVAAQETAAAQAEKTVAAQETAAAQAEKTVAAQETAAAQAEKTVVAQETAAAQAEKTVVAQETAAAQAEKTVVAKETAAAQAEATATARGQKEVEARSLLSDADQSISQGDYDQAVDDCTRAIELLPDLGEAYYKRGFVYTHYLDEYEKAIADYDRAIKLEPENKAAYANKGCALRELGRYDEALAALDQAIQLDPEYAWAYRVRGYVYSEREEYERAIEDYVKAIELDPGDAWAYANKGHALGELGRYDEALAALDQAIQLKPEYAWAYRVRGYVYSEREEYERAIEDYVKAIELDPGDAWAYAHKGHALGELGRYDEALAALDQAIQLKPEYAWAYHARGYVYAEREEYERAIEEYDKAIELDAELADAYFDRGLAYKQLGEKEKAIADFEEFLKLSKDEDQRSEAEQYLKELRRQ
jgi:tetratricopeptide (TPR) repeat protein